MDDCDCEFDPYLPEHCDPGDPLEESFHFRRTCEACGEVWYGMHCPHEGYQNPCPKCRALPATVLIA